jgi:hypothetical protein
MSMEADATLVRRAASLAHDHGVRTVGGFERYASEPSGSRADIAASG